MIVFSNMRDADNYVELQVSHNTALFDPSTRRNIVGSAAMFYIFSREARYDEAVGLEKKSANAAEVENWAREQAQRFGLVEDKGLRHRHSVWAVK